MLVDYRGILKELDTAIRAYQDLETRTQGGFDVSDLEGLYHQFSTEYKQLPALHDKLWSFFKSVANKLDREQYRQLLTPKFVKGEDGEDYDERQKLRDDFYEALTAFGLCLQTALSSRSFFEDKSFSESLIARYKSDLRFFTELRQTARRDAMETVDYSVYEEQIRKLVDKQVIGTEVREPEGVYLVHQLGKAEDPKDWSDEKMRDRDLVKVWEKMNKHRFDNIRLKTKTVGAQATPEGIQVQFEGLDGTKSEGTYDLVLQAVGRTPNGKKIAAEKAGVAVTDRGFINVDIQMRTNVRHIFAIGDIVGQPMLAHKAVHEAHVAAEVIAGELQGNKELAAAAFNARVIPSVAYTDPEVAWVGLTEDQAKAQGIKVKKGLFPWSASGRAIANGRDEGVTKLLFDDSPEAGSGDGHAGRGHGKILGGGMVGTHAGDMIGEIALAIEMGADAVDIGKTIHPHPTLGESIGMAAEIAHGSCTDVPPQKK